jgi:hypothetical protein
MFKSRNTFAPSVGIPAVYDQFPTFEKLIDTMYADPTEPERYDIIKLYGHTLSRYAVEIGELCGFDEPAKFVDDELYEFYHDYDLDEWRLFNITKWHYGEKVRIEWERTHPRNPDLDYEGETEEPEE